MSRPTAPSENFFALLYLKEEIDGHARLSAIEIVTGKERIIHEILAE